MGTTSHIAAAVAALLLSGCGSEFYSLTDVEKERAQINAKMRALPGESFQMCMEFEKTTEKDAMVLCFFQPPSGHMRSISCSYHHEFCEN
jgi:hypothetical protein